MRNLTVLTFILCICLLLNSGYPAVLRKKSIQNKREFSKREAVRSNEENDGLYKINSYQENLSDEEQQDILASYEYFSK